MRSDLSPKTFKTIAWAMTAIAAVAYVNNVIVFPSLRAPDGFGHFTYIWYLASVGKMPWAMEGWSFFHPPLYYAFMASVWKVAPAIDPIIRLKIGTGIIAFLGIAQAGVAYLIVRRSLPTNRIAQLLAIGLMLFLPLQLFTVGYIGNERLNAVLCGTSLLALLWLLDRPVWTRAVVLGALLGAALLVKFTALAVVAGCFATLFLSFLFRREYGRGLKILLVVGVTMLSVCGWFYLRNVVQYGNPFQLSRETEMVERVENFQTQGERSLLEYVLFDPLIIASPQWPRGIPLSGILKPEVERSALRESVWTGVFANAWFDGVGGVVIPIIAHNPVSKHSGQIILALALVPTLLILIGIGTCIRRLWRDGWSDVDGAMLISFVAMLTVFIYGSIVVPMHAAIKASYLTPVSVIFSFWLAMGFDVVCQSYRNAARGAVAVCTALAMMSLGVFTLGALVGRGYLRDGLDNRVWQNVYGVVEYAGGQKKRALEMFEASASGHWHLGHENVAALAFEAGDPREAIEHLMAAVRWQPRQSFGLPEDREKFDNAAQAEYSTLLAVAYYRIGWLEAGLRAAADAVERDRGIPEATYNLGMLELAKSLSLSPEVADRSALIARARDHFHEGWSKDPAFSEAITMRGVAEALLGDCDGALASFDRADEIASNDVRKYPFVTGPGDMHSAGLHRRLRIRRLPRKLEPALHRRRCEATVG